MPVRRVGHALQLGAREPSFIDDGQGAWQQRLAKWTQFDAVGAAY
jgi:hypothetical protein